MEEFSFLGELFKRKTKKQLSICCQSWNRSWFELNYHMAFPQCCIHTCFGTSMRLKNKKKGLMFHGLLHTFEHLRAPLSCHPTENHRGRLRQENRCDVTNGSRRHKMCMPSHCVSLRNVWNWFAKRKKGTFPFFWYTFVNISAVYMQKKRKYH